MRRLRGPLVLLALISAGLIALAGGQGGTGQGLERVKARGVLICGVASAAKPFGFLDERSRQLRGYDIDICDAVARHMGVRAEPVAVSVEQRVAELNSGRIDMLAAVLGWTPERARQIDYSHRYFVSHQIVIVRPGAGIKTLADLNGRRISAAKGSTAEQYLRAVAPRANLLTFQDAPSGYLAFTQGKVEAMAVSDLAALQLRHQSGYRFETLQAPLKVEPWGLAVRKGDHAMLGQVNKALENMEASGEGRALFVKWFGPSSEFAQQRQFVFGPIAPNGGTVEQGLKAPTVPWLGAPILGRLWQGLLTTAQLFVFAWLIAFGGGLCLTLVRASPIRGANHVVATFVEFTRNIPLLVQVMFWYFAVPSLLPESMRQWLAAHDGEFLLATLALGMALAGYFSEAMRSGLRAIPRTQTEAGRALGFSYFETMRHVILPQALHLSVPPLVNNTILLFQNTSIALAIGVHELMYQTRAIDNETYRTAEIFGVATLIYLTGSALLTGVGVYLERRSARGRGAR